MDDNQDNQGLYERLLRLLAENPELVDELLERLQNDDIVD